MSEHYYRLLLDDWSLPGFVSGGKSYYGTLEQIGALIMTMKEDMRNEYTFLRLKSAYERFMAGERNVTHCVAYNEVPFLVPAKVLGIAESILTDHQWDHLNTWDCIYQMKCDCAESQHIWLSCQGEYNRCIQTNFANLFYDKAYRVEHPWIGGFPHQIEVEENVVSSRLFVVEKEFENEAELMLDQAAFQVSPDVNFTEVMNDVFGSG